MGTDPGTVDGPHAPSRFRRALRFAARILAGVALALVAGSLVGAVALFGPYYRDDRALDSVVQWVALDWRDFGEARATERLQLELDKQRVGLHVADDACGLVSDGAERVVRCAWSVVVTVPVAGWEVPLAFHSEARVLPDGRLR